MNPSKEQKSPIKNFSIIVGIGILQYVAAMLVLLLFTLLFPNLDIQPSENPILFVIIIGFTYSIGIYGLGWLSLHFHWRKAVSKYRRRAMTTLIGIFIPLLIALLTYPQLEPGNPFFFICIITGIIGFLLPEWLQRT